MMARHSALAGLIWSLCAGEALAGDTPSAPTDQPIVTALESASVTDSPAPALPPVRRLPKKPDCPDQPDISGQQAEFNAYNTAKYASALEAKGMVPTLIQLKWPSLTHERDAKERKP